MLVPVRGGSAESPSFDSAAFARVPLGRRQQPNHPQAEEEELTADDVTRAFNEGNPDAQAILNRYNCQKAHELPDGHWLMPHWTRRFC